MHNQFPRKRMSVFTATALGLSAVAITCIVSASFITVYGMRIVDKKSDTLVGAVQVLIEELPALKQALPPVLADAVSDERRPDYRDQLDIAATVHHDPERSRYPRVLLAVTNNGDEVISTLAVRTVVLDEEGRPVSATTEYVATPLAIDNDWRGPLLPGSTRRATTTHYCRHSAGSVECEVTELRIWCPETTETPEGDTSVGESRQKPVELAASTP